MQSSQPNPIYTHHSNTRPTNTRPTNTRPNRSGPQRSNSQRSDPGHPGARAGQSAPCERNKFRHRPPRGLRLPVQEAFARDERAEQLAEPLDLLGPLRTGEPLASQALTRDEPEPAAGRLGLGANFESRAAGRDPVTRKVAAGAQLQHRPHARVRTAAHAVRHPARDSARRPGLAPRSRSGPELSNRCEHQPHLVTRPSRRPDHPTTS